MLDADLNSRYWYHLGAKYRAKNFFIKLVLLIMTSVTALSFLFTKHELIWIIFSTAAALLALFHLLLNWEKLIEKCYLVRKEWNAVKEQYEILWAKFKNKQISDNEIERDYSALKQRENYITYIESDLPYKNRLIRKCQKEVLNSRGLRRG